MDTFLIIKNKCSSLPTDYDLKQYTVFQVKERDVPATLRKHKNMFPECTVLYSLEYNAESQSDCPIYSMMKDMYGSNGVKAKLFKEKFNSIVLVEGVTEDDFYSSVLTAVDEWKKQTNPDTTDVYNGIKEGKEYCLACCDTMKKQSVVLKCKHQFCYKCIMGQYYNKMLKSCPVCRHPNNMVDINRGKIVYCLICDDVMDNKRIILKCNHKFCYKCIKNWCHRPSISNHYCPACISCCCPIPINIEFPF